MPVFLSGSLIITGSMTTSGTITAQTLVVQTITSSIVNLTGSNIFGSTLSNSQTFTGSVNITGSLTVNTTGTEFQVTNNGVVMGNLLTDNHSVTGSLRVTGSGTFTSTISAIGESTLFRGAYNDPVPNTAAVLKMSATPTTSTLSAVVGARMSGSATANFDSYAGYFSNIALSSGTGLSYGIFATASFHTFIGETRLAQGVFNDPVAGTAASVKISATPVSGYPTAVFTAGATGAASSNQNTYAGYFTNTSTVSGTGVNYGIYATGSSHYLGGTVGINTTTPNLSTWSGAARGMEIYGASGQYSLIKLNSADLGNFYLLNGVSQYWIYGEGNYPMSFTTSGSERMRITSGGSLLIGSTTQAYNPQTQGYLLGVKSNTTQAFISIAKSGQTLDSGGMIVGLDTTTGYVYVRENIALTLATNDTERMRITSGGNVGIGTTSPSAKLHTYLADGANDNRLLVQQGSNGYASGINLVANNNDGARYNYINSGPNNSIAMWQIGGGGVVNTMIMYTSGSERMRITSDGYVGIQTTAPASKLHVAGAGNAAGGNIIMGQINDSTAKWSYLVSTQYNSSTQPQGFTLIGGYSAATENTVVIGGSIYEANPATSIQFWTHTAVSHSLGGSQRMTITSGGDVLVGTTSSPSAYGKLIIRGTNQGLTIQDAATNGYRSIYSQSGNLYFYNGTNEGYLSTAGTWVDASDATLKKDIKDIEYGLNKVLELKPKWYKMIDNNLEQIGFIAQDVEEVLPELVSTSERGMKGLSYGQLTAVLVKAIQELEARIKELENK